MTIEELLAEVMQLSLEEQVPLLEELRHIVTADHSVRVPATALRGVGRELWDGTDAQEYVDRERDSWGG